MIGKSKHSEKFILKGAMVFSLWFDVPHRSTRDIDLMGFGEINISHMEQVFRDICTVADPDSGLTFDLESVKGEDIKAQDEYKGIRIILKTFLGKIRIPLQVDIGFGDTIFPDPIFCNYPTLLDMPAPQLRTYPQETVVSEKIVFAPKPVYTRNNIWSQLN